MKPELHTLSNGLRVVFIDTKTFPSLTTLVLIGAGSRYETAKNNGIAHFYEHMLFKGSEKYKNSYMISSLIEGLGGYFNAFTAKDHTGYWVKAPNAHFDSVIDVLSDVLLRPTLEPDEIEREKGVIVEEVNMYEDTPSDRVEEIFEELMYPDHPLGYDILGTKQTINSFKRPDFTEYMDKYYHPRNVVLVVAGGLTQGPRKDTKSYLNLIQEKLGDWNGEARASFDPVIEKQSRPQSIIRHKKTEQAHFCLGFRTFSFFDQRRYALSMLTAILGGGMSSRLFSEVREKRGLCYYISTGRQLYADVGNMVTQAGVVNNFDKVKESVELVLKEHKKIRSGEITKEEVERAKEMIKGRLVLSLEKSENVASFFGNELMLRNTLETTEETIKFIDKVTVEDIVSVAEQIFIPERLNFSLIGPFKTENNIADVLNI